MCVAPSTGFASAELISAVNPDPARLLPPSLYPARPRAAGGEAKTHDVTLKTTSNESRMLSWRFEPSRSISGAPAPPLIY